jgi:hypothetical protein
MRRGHLLQTIPVGRAPKEIPHAGFSPPAAHVPVLTSRRRTRQELRRIHAVSFDRFGCGIAANKGDELASLHPPSCVRTLGNSRPESRILQDYTKQTTAIENAAVPNVS